MKLLLILTLLFAFQSFAQDTTESLDEEVSEVSDQADTPPEDVVEEGNVEQPEEIVIEKKEEPRQAVQIQDNRMQTQIDSKEPIFVKPPAPPRGGSVRVPHPNAAKGLLKISKDNVYQYKVPLRPKTQSSSLRIGPMTPPKITGDYTSYEEMYGKESIPMLMYDYEWQPFTTFGRIGLNLGFGFGNVKGRGYFASGDKAQESFNLFIVPLSAFLSYRFEYVRRQWVVPFISGGGTYYGMAELRDDNKKNNFAGAAAVGGGGGLHFSISALDPRGAFTMDREYGIADMYFTVEARAMQGVNKNIDFTNQSITGGITVDY